MIISKGSYRNHLEKVSEVLQQVEAAGDFKSICPSPKPRLWFKN
jgi:hypothetical protein